ncbi:MAG: DUF805 domain-containing protein [Chloroflexi bacterium]|nr:DUF805 domain-containing protein [Chloroflexota bacterium]
MILLGHRTAVTEVERRHRRTNRRTYVVEVLLIFAVSLAVEFALDRLGVAGLWVDLLLASLLLFLVARAFAGRTHDLGRTDYWTIIPLLIFAGGWLTSFFWADAPLAIEIASHLAWSVALVSVAFVKGNEGENRFGAAPEDAIELKVITNVG